MTNLRQDRVPDQTLSQGSAPEGNPTADGRVPASTRGIELAVRLWTQDSSGQTSAVSWQSVTPSVGMVLDLISAAGGAPETSQGPILHAGFYNAQSALLMVRRLQWALQGFADSSDSRSIAVAMLIHSAKDAPGEPLAAAIENAAPGQVLLSNTIAETVSQIPNVTLRAAGQGGGLVEVQWRSGELESGSAADEQSMLRLIRELGRNDPLAPEPQAAYSERQTSRSEAPSPPMATGSFTANRARVEDDSAEAGRKKKWLMIGGGAAAVLVAGIFVISGLVSGRHDKTPPVPADTTTTKPAESATTTTQTSQPDSGAKTESTKSAQKPGKTSDRISKSKSEGSAEGKNQGPPAGQCYLTDAEIPRSLDRAEGYLHAGRLTDARAVYQRLLGCPSARQRATEGLQIVKQRIAAGSP